MIPKTAVELDLVFELGVRHAPSPINPENPVDVR